MAWLHGYRTDNYTEKAMSMIEPVIHQLTLAYDVPGMTYEDLAQDLRFQCYRKFDRYNPQKSTIRGWARTVMRNRIIDLIYRTRVEPLDLKYREELQVIADPEDDRYEWIQEEVTTMTFQWKEQELLG